MVPWLSINEVHPGQEQVDLASSSRSPALFGGALTTNERRDKYEAQAVEFTEVYEFGSGKKVTKEPAIRFICISDAVRRRRAPGLLDEARRVEPLRKQSLWCLVSI